MIRHLIVISAGLALAGCQSIPVPLQVEAEDVAPWVLANEQQTGAVVRWGGAIVGVEEGVDLTCFEIVSRPLGYNAQPMDVGYSDGRFLACKDKLTESAPGEGREVTVTGTVVDYERREVDEEEFELPIVAADALFVWPDRGYSSYFSPFVGWSVAYFGSSYWGGGYYHPHPPYHPPTGKPPQPGPQPRPPRNVGYQPQPVDIKREK